MASSGQQLRLELDVARSKQGHGSRACYIAGCHDTRCVMANARYMRDYRNGLRGRHDKRMGGYRIDDPQS